MPGSSRKGVSRSDTRERLLRVACRQFADRGYQNTRIQDVCRLAGANIAAVNYHFGGKEGLYRAVWDHALEQTVRDEDGAPVLTTAATKPGLTYTLREGATLGTLSDGDTKQGDGQSWTPTITVKGGASGFYRIKVGK